MNSASWAPPGSAILTDDQPTAGDPDPAAVAEQRDSVAPAFIAAVQ